jgi:hypothetical protein
MNTNGFKRLFFLWFLFLIHTGFLSAQIPAGYYYNARNKQKVALKTALHELTKPLRVLRYGSGTGYTWEGFFYTDKNQDGSVIDMYSPVIRYFDGFKSVSGMHIEHAFPKSWWGGHEWPVYKDLFHLYPADGSINMSKSNNPLGVVTGTPTSDNGISKVGPATYPGYSGNVFEPADEFKGDFARSYFYVVTAYQDLAPYWNSPMLNKNTYPVWTPWAIELLKQWHEQDPVSIKEALRQEAVFNIQGNRNPFIDYPDLVQYIWGSDTVKVYPFPVETAPFIASPRLGEKVSFDVILQGDSLVKPIWVQGVNITSGLNISLKKNNPGFSLKTTSLSQQNALNGTSIELIFCPTSSGSFIDTLMISGGGLTQPRLVPVSGKASKDFMVLEADEHTPVGAKLSWIADPHATDYQLTVFQGAAKAGNLLISSYVEGSGYNKAVELYNGTGRALDLSDYTLMKQSNGTGDFKTPYRMSGSLINNKTYLIALNDSRNILEATADAVNDSVMSFNGNDAIALYHNGIMIDVVGYSDAGSALIWGENKTLKRKSSVTHPVTRYDEFEWNTHPVDYFDLLGSHQIAYQTPEVPLIQSVSTQAKPYFIVEGLSPESTYNYHVDVIEPGKSTRSVNTIQFKTTGLSAPEVNAARDIQSSGFTANWEPDIYTNTYLLDVFALTGTGDVTVIEGFDNIGLSGKVIFPDGWLGTASGRYTTAASSGIATPSLQLANAGEYVQTKTYPHPVKSLSFMYRFPSSGTGSYFVLQAFTGENWEKIDSVAYSNTSKYYPSYNFTIEDNVTAFKITYYKVAGNFALDDFTIIYGNQEVNYILQHEPVTGNERLVDSLEPQTNYYYTVRSTLGNSVSPSSEQVKVTTSLDTGEIPTKLPVIKYSNTANGVCLTGLAGGEIVRVYTVSGILCHQQEAKGNSLNISLKSSDVYILSVQNEDYSAFRKIIR